MDIYNQLDCIHKGVQIVRLVADGGATHALALEWFEKLEAWANNALIQEDEQKQLLETLDNLDSIMTELVDRGAGQMAPSDPDELRELLERDR